MDILFIGHSLVEFYDWQARFPQHRVANLGVAGETVDSMLWRLDGIKDKYPSADLIVLMSGLNDVAMGDMDFLDDYREAVEKLVLAYPGAKIFVNSILPTLSAFIPDRWIKNANDALKGMADDLGLVFLNVYELFMDGSGMPIKEYILGDEVHLSEKGYAVWSKALEDEINDKML